MIVSQQRSVCDAAHMNRYILFNEGNYFSEFIHLVEEDYIVSRLLEYAPSSNDYVSNCDETSSQSH